MEFPRNFTEEELKELSRIKTLGYELISSHIDSSTGILQNTLQNPETEEKLTFLIDPKSFFKYKSSDHKIATGDFSAFLKDFIPEYKLINEEQTVVQTSQTSKPNSQKKTIDDVLFPDTSTAIPNITYQLPDFLSLPSKIYEIALRYLRK